MPSRPLAELVAAVVPPACAACRGPTGRADLRLCGECLRALPWLPRGVCPRCALPRHRRGCPAAASRVRRRLGAARLRRGRAPPDRRAQVPRRAPARGGDGRARRRQPAAGRGRPARPPRRGGAARGPGDRGRGRAAAAGAGACPGVRCGRCAGGGAGPAARAARAALPPAARSRLAPGRGDAGAAAQRRADRGLRCAPVPRRALLVDDVHTTGATLDACARALLDAGCGEVVAVTYARTL